MTDAELKPCPFCGSKKIKIDRCTKRVRCGECFATSGIISRHMKDGLTDYDAAIIAWNERYDDAKNERG